MKKIINEDVNLINKIKYIIILVVGIIIGSSACVIGSNVINANQVGINSSKTTKTNMQDAIDELYDKSNMIGFKAPKATGATIVKTNLPEGVKAIVYLDPTDLSKSCNSSNSVSTTGTKTGCMKWYAYKEDSEYYTMILDHNTTAKIAWNSSNSTTYPKTIQSEIDKLVTVSKWKATPRIISGNEIANITGNGDWPTKGWYHLDSNSQNLTVNSTNKSKFAWIYDYTNGCAAFGCNNEDSSTKGYWTSTTDGNSANVWLIYFNCNFSALNSSSTNVGLRPVITISK